MSDEVLTKQGVRNLDVMMSDKYREAERRKREAERRKREADFEAAKEKWQEEKTIHDLLYDDNQELREELLSVWPEAKLNGVYDDIHENRLEVTLEGTILNYYKWLVRSGWAAISFSFQTSVMLPEDKELIELVMDSEAPGWRKR